MPAQSQPYKVPRSLQWALLLSGLLWLVAARIAAEHAAAGFAVTLKFVALQPVLTEVFFLFLLLGGFATLHWIATREGGVRNINALPQRSTTQREWFTGAALGWGMLLVAVVPMVLLADLHPDFWLAPRAFGLTGLSLLALAAGSLAMEVGFRGYLFRRLILIVGPTTATLLMAFGCAVLLGFRGEGTGLSFVFLFAEAILFALAYHRTHALWLGWGLRFGWTASMAILFGLPVRGSVDYSSVIATVASGRSWVTGRNYGPDGSLFGLLAVVIGMFALYSLTKDYAWEYTHEPIVAGGYAVVVQPPAAHTAMEQAAVVAPAPLVQIASITPAAPSTSREIEEHLRGRTE